MTNPLGQPAAQPRITLEPWKVLKEQTVFESPPWIRVARQSVLLPDGRVIDDYHRIDVGEFAVVFAQTDDNRVIVERHYKHGIGKVSLALPAGMIEQGEHPTAAARRELLEETGYAAEEWTTLGSYAVSSNYGSGRAHMFMARKAESVAAPDSGDLEEMELLLMSVPELVRAAREGEVQSLSSITLIAMATNPLFAGGLE